MLSVTTVAKAIPLLTDAERGRFLSYVERGADGDCWPWRGGMSGSGYGSFYLRGEQYQAHRMAVRADGYSVPTWAVIDHICRNRRCCNPAHLRTVTRGTNVHENSLAPGHLNSLKTHCPQGHPYSGDNLTIRASGRRRCNERQKKYRRSAGTESGWVGNADAPKGGNLDQTDHA